LTDADRASIAALAEARAGSGIGDPTAAVLDGVDPASIPSDGARIAFWINLYNALLLDELARTPRRGSLLRHRAILSSAKLRVGALEYSLDVIEHGVLRRNARLPYRPTRALRRGDPRTRAAPSRLDPRIHFALNCGAVSCPRVTPYEAAALDRGLEAAATAYIRAETVLDRDRGRVELPYLMRLYKRDFGDRADAIELAARHLEPEDGAWLLAQDRVRVGYRPFDWTLEPG